MAMVSIVHFYRSLVVVIPGVNLELPKEESPVRFVPSENCAEDEAGISSVEAGDVNEVCDTRIMYVCRAIKALCSSY